MRRYSSNSPGHTPGHIALRLCESGLIICGDAANINDGVLLSAVPAQAHDLAAAEESFKKITLLNATGCVCYHSGYLSVDNEISKNQFSISNLSNALQQIPILRSHQLLRTQITQHNIITDIPVELRIIFTCFRFGKVQATHKQNNEFYEIRPKSPRNALE